MACGQVSSAPAHNDLLIEDQEKRLESNEQADNGSWQNAFMEFSKAHCLQIFFSDMWVTELFMSRIRVH